MSVMEENVFASGDVRDSTSSSPVEGQSRSGNRMTNLGAPARGAASKGRYDLESGVGKEPTATTWGGGPVTLDPRKYRYDIYRARSTNIGFNVTRDDRMSAEEAGAMLHTIHEMLKIEREDEARIAAFDRALFFCHTVNSGSTLQPGATKLCVDGVNFEYGDIVRKLGNDIRRFFRAFADDIAQVNREIIAGYDPYDHASVERVGWIQQIALERGLQRFPYLAHDSADACVKLTPAERAAVVASKREVLSTTVNSADSMMANPRVANANRFDSTTRSNF